MVDASERLDCVDRDDRLEDERPSGLGTTGEVATLRPKDSVCGVAAEEAESGNEDVDDARFVRRGERVVEEDDAIEDDDDDAVDEPSDEAC